MTERHLQHVIDPVSLCEACPRSSYNSTSVIGCSAYLKMAGLFIRTYC